MKESKSARIERIKREKDGLDVVEDIYRYAKHDGEIDPEDIDRLKWYGVYIQNRSLQPKEDTNVYFMLRIKIKNATLNTEQIKKLGELSIRYAKGYADFTTRQDMQFHWVQMRDLPIIFEALKDIGLTTRMACGDVVRNTVTCPLNTKSGNEIEDVSDIVEEINRLFDGNRNFSNLPRKFKIGVSGCGSHCMPHEIQDLAFVAQREKNNELRFALFVGGGLASNRRFADFLGYIKREEIVPIAKATVEIFRDFGNREKRNRARLGHLIRAWGVERFKGKLQELSGVDIRSGDLMDVTPAKKRHHCGIVPSNKAGYSHIGCSLYGGVLGGERLLKLYDLMKKRGLFEIRTTSKQNFLILDVPDSQLKEVCDDLEQIKINPYTSAFRTKTTACTGLDFCKFAISETKSVAEDVASYLENRFPTFKESVSISINGCPHSCAHPCIVDIGLSGSKFTRDGVSIRGFELLVGGKVEGERSRFSKRTGVLLTHEEIPYFLENIIDRYLQSDYGNFAEFLAKEDIAHTVCSEAK